MFLKEGEEGREETENDMGSTNEQGEHRSQVSVTFYISPVPLRHHLRATEKQEKNKQVTSTLWWNLHPILLVKKAFWHLN